MEALDRWQKLSEEEYKLDFRTVSKWQFKTPDDQETSFDIIVGQPVAIIVALTPENEVIIAKQFRPGPSKILMELPAGILDPGETPLEAAKRELTEETGYIGDFHYVGFTYQGAYSTVELHSFVATNCRKVAGQKLDANEFVESTLIPLVEFRSLLKTGQLTDAGPAYMALDYLNLL